MSYSTIQEKGFTWWHFSTLEESDFSVLEKEFDFHPLDYDALRDKGELAKVDTYPEYIFGIVTLPVLGAHAQVVKKQNVSIFLGETYMVTVTDEPLETLERFFTRMERSEGMREATFGKSTGYFLYKLLDHLFKDVKVVLRELVRESEHVELHVYDRHTRVTTRRLGILRRQVLQLRQIIEPQRVLLGQYISAHPKIIKADLQVYFDDVKDALDGMSVVLDNTREVVDGLFAMNEAFLSHRTNDIIRVLTVISVVLMPPTLITGYYGMNIDALPFGDSVVIVSLIILGSIFGFWMFISYIDRK